MCPTAKPSSLGLSKRARQIWEWCQAEGGGMRGISQGEVAAMLQEGGQIPPDVQQLIDRRFCCLKRQSVQQHQTCVQGCINAVL